MNIEHLMEKVKEYLPPEKLAIVEEAYQFALKAHEGQMRLSGEPYVQHPLETASLLADLQLDGSTIAAALLHDVPEDCGVSISEIEDKFGPEISKLVDGATKLSRISWQVPEKAKKGAAESELYAENLRRMLMAMAEDLRVVFIKLADRLHNMRTLDALPTQKQRSIARETLEIYAPLAHRLGIWELKWQLEDLSFLYTEPNKYRQIGDLIKRRGIAGQDFIDKVIQILSAELDKIGLKAEVTGRPKNIYSVHQKMERYAARGKDFGQIYDIIALRVLVDKTQDCYHALGTIHNLWHPIRGEFNDYIANPKENGYQSLHTTVMCLGTTPLEIQIRTRDMHRLAEYGVAAHWRYKYKESAKGDLHFEDKMAWLRQLIEWHRELSSTTEFLESVKTDIFHDQVFVYTPQGEIKDLPAGSTPIDFAYRIHTDLGHHCIGARVNGRLVHLSYHLANGDTVEILTTKKDKGPSRDWLNPNLGYIKTSHAKTKIRQWFNKQERAENIERGKEILEKGLRRLGISLGEREKIAHIFKYKDLDDFHVAIGCGEISVHQIALKLLSHEEQPQPVVSGVPTKERVSSSIQVLGIGDLLTRTARCCNPVPGDEIIGYITRSRGVSIHRKDCPNIIHIIESDRERLVPVDWGKVSQLYPVDVRIEAWDRVGLIRDISSMAAEEGVNIASMSTTEHQDYTISIFATLETKGVGQLSRLLSKMEGVRGAISVVRCVEGTGVKEN